MKVGLIGMSLLICAALACSAVAQSPTLPADRPTVEAALAIEDPAERIAALQRLLKNVPAAELADAAREALVASWAQLGEVQLGENNIEKAAANFRKAVSSLPETVTDEFFNGTVIRIPLAVSVRGYRNEALELGRLLERRFGKEPRRLAALGEFFMTVEAPADAIRALEAASRLASDEALLHCALGAAYRMGLRLDDAIAEYQLAIGADAKEKRAYYELANLYRAYGSYADAIKLYQKQIEIEPKHAPSFKGLALSYLAQGDEGQMTAALNQARDLRGSAEEITGDIYLQTQMAFYYLKQKKLKQARAAAEAALLIEPRYAWARIAAAEVDMAEDKVFEAERNLLAAQRYAGFPTLFFTFGKLYLSVEDFDGALDQFSKAFRFSPKDQFTTRLGGSLDVRAEGVKELLAREQQASLFVADSPTTPEQFKQAEALARFNVWLNDIKAITASGKGAVTRKQMEELDRAAMEFVESEGVRRSFRSLYVAQRLSQAGAATGLAVELAEQALGLAEVATEADGSVRDYPNYDRNGRLQIFRGRALDAKGWALYKASKNDEAVAALDEAVKAYGTLPEGKRARWHLAAVKEDAGELESALEYYLTGYEPPEAGSADVKGAVIEVLYQKVNGSKKGLEERLRQAEQTNPEINTLVSALSQRSQQPAKELLTLNKRQPNKKSGEANNAPKTALPPLSIAAKEPEPSAPATKPDRSADTVPVVTTTEIPDEPKKDKEPKKESSKEFEKEKAPEKEREREAVEAVPAPISAKPVELPEVASSEGAVTLIPLFDPQTVVSQWEVVTPGTVPGSEDEVPPTPPTPTHTRPRRVVTSPSDDPPAQTAPSRLRRPPAPPEELRLRRPPSQSNFPINQ